MLWSTDPRYLKTSQDCDAASLKARLLSHQRFSTNRHRWLHWTFDTLVKLPSHARVVELPRCRDKLRVTELELLMVCIRSTIRASG